MDPSGLSNGQYYLNPYSNPKPPPLSWQSQCKGDILPLNYGPISNTLKNYSGIRYRIYHSIFECISGKKIIKKGGDPAAGSPTATLWQLTPSCWAQIWVNQKIKPHLNSARVDWWAVCARLIDIFTGRWWRPITRNSIVMRLSYKPQSELR